MKKLILVICSFFMFFSCNSQQNEKLNNQEKEQIMNETYNSLINPDISYPHLTTSNFVETVSSIALKYESDKEPVYYVQVDNQNCGYEILVNDMPIEANYLGVRYSSPFILNYDILNNGKQVFTYRLYPLHETMGDSTVFGEDASFSIQILKRDNRISFREEQVLLEHKADILKDGKRIFPAIGKNYYADSISFNAEFPHEIMGWSAGQDLTKFNNKRLEEEVLRFYHKQWLIAKNKDIEAWYSYQYTSEVERAIRYYYKNDELLKLILDETLDTRINLDIIEMYPIKDYEMKFYGNDKVICLGLTDNNPQNYGEGVIHFKYQDKEGTGDVFIKLYLYLPEGKELKADNFIIIR